jgi:hypothetical protein
VVTRRQVGGRGEVFLWRGREYKQPVYNKRGIATVTDVQTGEVLYRGPGDNYVAGHPANTQDAARSGGPGAHGAGASNVGQEAGVVFVLLKRGHARVKRARVMVDLARVVLRLVPRASKHKTARKGDPALGPDAQDDETRDDDAVGCSLQVAQGGREGGRGGGNWWRPVSCVMSVCLWPCLSLVPFSCMCV